MQIIWHGQSFFEIIAGRAKNGQVVLVIDPFSEEIGLRFPKVSADIVAVTSDLPDHNNAKAVAGNSNEAPFLISGPGEYEVKEIYIQGILSNKNNGKENTIFTIKAEDLKICHLGDLAQKELTSEQVEQIGDVDVLMIPVGGNNTIDGKEALKIMSQIEPKIIIPMHYMLPKLKTKLEDADKFLKSVGVKKVEPLPKLTIKKKDISEEEVKIIILKP